MISQLVDGVNRHTSSVGDVNFEGCDISDRGWRTIERADDAEL